MPNAKPTDAVYFKIGVEPTEAIEYLRQKKMLAAKVFTKQLQESALARATTIARLTSLEMTKDIYASMEKAMKEGKAFSQWKKELVAEFERKGWVAGFDKKISRGIDGKLLADPKTGEYFGTPRRLNTIYRVNTQAAYSAARFQRMMENVDNRPYWQYSAVGDERTRPAHLALNGRVYRYDDPFWATFYPPNGFNCRCTVIALSDRDLKRKGLDSVGSSEAFLVEAKYPKDKFGSQEKTVGFKLSDGSVRVVDKGFDYNIGRLTYRPNLDLYPEKLAHQFAKVEMSGGEFKHEYDLLAEAIRPRLQEYQSLKSRKEREAFLDNLRNMHSRNYKFAAGILTEKSQKKIGTKLKTIWFSDDSLVKQIAHHESQFGIEAYEILPDVLNTPDEIISSKDKHFELHKEVNGKKYMAVIKVLENVEEIFLQSFRRN